MPREPEQVSEGTGYSDAERAHGHLGGHGRRWAVTKSKPDLGGFGAVDVVLLKGGGDAAEGGEGLGVPPPQQLLQF